VGAYVTVCGERALEEARAPRPGPFAGVPIPIKDLTETAGVRTTFSCKAFADYVPERDRVVVRRLREAGFVVLGKTNTPELGTAPVTESELNGVCRNPWDRTRTPGGSSGGAAAAVAAGLAPVAHASDGGGSIRIPASCCGLFGLKPSRGRVTPAPYADVNGLGTAGTVARTVADAAALLDVLAGPEPGDAYVAPPPARPFAEEAASRPPTLRVAVTTEPPFDTPVDRACAAAAHGAAQLLAELGHRVEEATPPWRQDDVMRLFTVLWQPLPALAGVSDLSLLEPLNRALVERAAQTSSIDYLDAYSRLQLLARRVVAFWDVFDVVLTPTLALPPVPIGWTLEPDDPWEQFDRGARFSPFTALANVTGQPAASVPFDWCEDGLPLGVQLIGRPFDEATLLRLAAQLEQARPWAERLPEGV
jgi:amidase